MDKKYRVLVVGCGGMGGPHSRAYHKLDEFEIVGIVTLNPKKHEDLAAELGEYIDWYTDFYQALEKTKFMSNFTVATYEPMRGVGVTGGLNFHFVRILQD